MTEKLKYKVGDKVLVPLEILEVREGDGLPYATKRFDGNNKGYWTKGTLESIAITLPQKPKVTQAVMDWYFKNQEFRWDVELYLLDDEKPFEVYKWIETGNLQLTSERQHALATLIAYGPQAVEVEKEKRYKVTLKATGQLLKKYGDKYIFAVDGLFIDLTKQELIDAGFEGVFDNPMFKVEEV